MWWVQLYSKIRDGEKIYYRKEFCDEKAYSRWLGEMLKDNGELLWCGRGESLSEVMVFINYYVEQRGIKIWPENLDLRLTKEETVKV